MIRRWLARLLCAHADWYEVRRIQFHSEGTLLVESCLWCDAKKWRML